MSEEVRYFQINMAENFGVETFVTTWNDVFPDNLGTYNKENDTKSSTNHQHLISNVAKVRGGSGSRDLAHPPAAPRVRERNRHTHGRC